MKKFLVAIPVVRFFGNGHDRRDHDSTVKKIAVISKVLSWGKSGIMFADYLVLMTEGKKRLKKFFNDDGLYLKQRRISSDVCFLSRKKLLTDEKLKF